MAERPRRSCGSPARRSWDPPLLHRGMARSVEEPDGGMGRPQRHLPAVLTTQPWAAPAEPREGRQGAAAGAEGAGRAERLPVLEGCQGARAPSSMELGMSLGRVGMFWWRHP